MHAPAFTAGRLSHLVGAIVLAVLSISPAASANAPTGTFSVQSFQTDYFTGAATATVPIVVPKGAAGTAPQIILTYNSTTVDDLKKTDQGQWTGLGWTLNIGGFVLRDTKNTATTSDDTFQLVFGGAAHDLVLIDSGQKIYHTKDEMFWKVQYFASGDYWVLTTKDGTQHRFGFNTDSKALTLNPDLVTTVVYKYMLDQASTTSGVQIRWAYVKQTGTAPATGHTYDQAVYPDTITWAYTSGGAIGNLRKVQFIRGPRADWTDTSATTQTSFHQTSRLDRLEVYTGTSLVCKYVFGYDYSIDRDPSATWGGGATGDLTLNTVTMYGTDGTTVMPALSFTYTPEGRISTANNGIGGSVSFTYEHLVTTPLYRTCLAGNCTDWGATTGTGGVLLGHILSSAALGETSPLYTECYNPYDATTGCLDWGIQQTPGVTLLGRLVVDDGVLGTLPLYQECQRWNGSNCADLALQTSGTSYRLGYIYSAPVDRYRVSVRTVGDGRGNNATTNVYYRDLAIASNGEFRGYGVARAVDPSGHYIDTWFKQDDVLKGRAYQTEARSTAGALFTQTVTTYANSNPYPGVTWIQETAIDVVTCDGGSPCRQVSKTLEYDSYGNQTWTHEWGDVAVNGDERHLNTVWVADANRWIHRPSVTALYNDVWSGLRVTWFFYDGLANGSVGSSGLLTKEERNLNGNIGTVGNPITTRGYDAYGNPTSVTDPRNCTTTTAYDASQTFPVTATNCLGHTATAQFDERFGVKTSARDPNNQTTTYSYDVFGRLIQETDPLDTASYYGTVNYAFNNLGDPNNQHILTRRTTTSGTSEVLWVAEHFDGLGRKYLVRKGGPTDQIVQEESFDARGLVSAKAAPHTWAEASVWTQYTYDPIGRRTQTLHPDGTTINVSYAPGTVIVTDELGMVKRSFYDAYDRLIKVEEVNDVQTYTTTYTYDAADSLRTVTNHAGHVTTITNDMLGRKTVVSDPNTGQWTYTYDAGGNLLSQTDANNQTLTYSYDQVGRGLTKTYPGGGQITKTYDDPAVAYSKGRLTRVVDLAAVTTLAYDQLGRQISFSRTLDGTTYTLLQSLDAVGRVTSQTFPDSETVSYTYNAAGWLASIPGYVSSVTYNSQGLSTQIQYFNGVTSTRTYNPNNFRVTNQTTSKPGTSLQNLSYTYNDVGNITQITDALWTASRTFTYDALRRLTSAAGTFGPPVAGLPSPTTQTYQFDAIGNITLAAGVTYAYSDTAHPAAVTSTSNGFTLTYDANGNMLTGAGRQATWDADNHLTSTTIQGGNAATFGYDYQGRRVRKQTSAGVTRYPFAGYEIDPVGVITKTLVLAGQRAVAKKSNGTTLYYHNDHLGGVSVVTGNSGDRVQLVEYTPWGMVSRSEGTADTQHTFNGRELDDPEIGLLYYGGRYYSAALGRFISPDPTVRNAGDPQSLNRYSYVENDPVNHTDPTGLKKKKSFWGRLVDTFVRAIPAIVVGVAIAVATVYTLGAAAPAFAAAYPLLVAAIAGAAGGAAAGAVNTGVNGGNLATNVLLGAAIGAVGSVVGGPLAGALKDVATPFGAAVISGALVGGGFGGVNAAISGGNILEGIAGGAIMGAVVSAVVYGGYKAVGAGTDTTIAEPESTRSGELPSTESSSSASGSAPRLAFQNVSGQLTVTDPVMGPSIPSECIPSCTTVGDVMSQPGPYSDAVRAAGPPTLDAVLGFIMGLYRPLAPGFPPGCCHVPPEVEGMPPGVGRH